jgi:hypothetical protein
MLMNYVALAPGIPRRLHFTDDYLVDRDITDPDTKKTKRIKTLVFQVDEVDGEMASKTFSVLSQSLSAALQPYLKDHAYRGWDFVITKDGSGFTARFKVEARPRTSQA